MKRSMSRYIMLAMLLLLIGCKKEDPNPELLDPIYKDLDGRAGAAQKSLDDELKKQADLKISLEKAEPNSIDLKNATRDLEKSQHLSLEFDQRARFYKIRAKRRLLVDRITYKAAFAKGETWPDPREYSDYQVNTRLMEAPRNWGLRVPKLKDRLVSSHGEDAKAKEKSPKGEE